MSRTTSPHPLTHLHPPASHDPHLLRPARLLATVALLAATPYVHAADLYYLGAQYTPGPAYPAPWPTAGSWFDPNLWQNNIFPASSYDNAIFGSTQPMPNDNTTHAPHTLHFGNFGYFGTTYIPGGTTSAGTVTILSDNWTFDFGSGQNPDYTGSPSFYNGRLYVRTLSLAPAAGQSAALTLQNGYLYASYVEMGSDGGQSLLTIGTGAYIITDTCSTIGITGPATITQTAGSHSLTRTSGTLYLGYNVGATGVYSLSGGLLAVTSEAIGYSGTGTFSQTSGTHTLSNTLYLGVNGAASGTYTQNDGITSAGTLTLGYNTTATGTFVLSNGYLYGRNQLIGFSGTGTFTQTGGSNTLSATASNYLCLGYNPGAVGSYSLAGGQLSTPLSYVGYSGTGIFNQTNGTHSISDTLYLGYNETASGTYTLSNGRVTASHDEHIGYKGTASFLQTGGTHNVATGTLWLGRYQPTAIGSYTLNAGQLTTGGTKVGGLGVGAFIQNGGTHTVNGTLDIGYLGVGSTYSLSNGQLTCSIQTVGRLGSGTFTQTGGTQSASYLYISLDNITTTGSYALSGGQLTVTHNVYVGYSGTALFNQTGGTHTLSGIMYLAYNAGSTGTYTLSDGQLTTQSEYIGTNGSARFVQSGGIHIIKDSTIGNLDIYIGSGYELSNGQLTTPDEYISGTGAYFTQSGGTHTITSGSLVLAGTASYTLSGGQLTTIKEYLGYSGIGTFTQTGGTHTVSGTLHFGYNTGSAGFYSLSDGTLTALAEKPFASTTFTQSGGIHTVSDYLPLRGSYALSNGQMSTTNENDIGTFVQTGGTHSVSGSLNVGPRGSSAVYTLNSGVLSAAVEILGTVAFTQTGGIHTISNYLAIGVNGGSVGPAIYSLSDAAILSTPCLYLGGDPSQFMGYGTLSVSGGAVTITDTLKIWSDSRNRLTLSGGTLTAGSFLVTAYPGFPSFSWTAGTLIITGPTAPALTIPTAGTFMGSPTIAGSLTNHGLLSPGQSPGLLTIQGDFTQADTATLLLEIAGPALPDFDRLSVPGTTDLPGNITLAGTVALAFLPGYIPAPGDSFDFLDWTGTFTPNGYTFDFTRAPLPTGWAWDTSAFNTTGILTILPEPATLALLALAAPLLLTRLTRRPSALPRPAQPHPSPRLRPKG